MKIETKANIGDELFYIMMPKGNSCNHHIAKYKVRDIGVTIYKKGVIYYTFTADIKYDKDTRLKSIYLDEGCFIKEADAIKEAEKLTAELLAERKSQREFDKKYNKDRAMDEINAIAKKNNLKVTIE
jgi:hypothetical protein